MEKNKDGRSFERRESYQLFQIALLIYLVAAVPVFSAIRNGQENVFGRPLFWGTPSEKTSSWLKQNIREKKSKLSQAWDPDCYYRPSVGGKCTKHSMQSDEKTIEELATSVKEETGGAFDVWVKEEKKRDFGGLGQGMFLESLARVSPGPWFGNFAGDIFVAPSFPKSGLFLSVPHPLFPDIPFARISLPAGGWVIASGSESQGTAVRPKPNEPGRSTDFEQVVLFAGANFNGGRLDAWATALVVGGKKTLVRLWENQTYKDQWGFFYFDSMGKAVCSSNLKCNLDDPPSKRKIVAFF